VLKKSLVKWCIVPLLVLVMAGCGGSNGGSVGSSPHTVSGIASAGSVLTGTVYLKDSSTPAKELSMPIAADGSYRFDLSGLTAPYILKSTGTANGRNLTLYSFAPDAGIANINPLSSLTITLAFGIDAVPLLYNYPDLPKMLVIKNALPSAMAKVQTALQPALARFGAETINFISAPYSANHQGLDLFLDNAVISTNNGIITLYDLTSSRTVQVTLRDFVVGTFDFILLPVTTVGTVCISPLHASVVANATKTFSANVIGLNDQSVTWSVVEQNGGSITSSGVYTAPATVGTYHVRATSSADSTKSATAAIEVSVGNLVNMISTAPGEYSVKAVNFSNVGGVEVTISYDSGALSNPRITQGALLAGTMFITNPRYSPNSLKLAAMSLGSILGSGTLATISFDLIGAAPNTPVITTVKIHNTTGAIPGSGDTVPVVEKPSDQSSSGSVPAQGGTGSVSTGAVEIVPALEQPPVASSGGTFLP